MRVSVCICVLTLTLDSDTVTDRESLDITKTYDIGPIPCVIYHLTIKLLKNPFIHVNLPSPMINENFSNSK